jgi:hypothetical protein
MRTRSVHDVHLLVRQNRPDGRAGILARPQAARRNQDHREESPRGPLVGLIAATQRNQY